MIKIGFQSIKTTIGILFLSSMIFFIIYDKYELTKNTRYTTCTTIKYYVPHPRSGLRIKYEYLFNNKVYIDYTAAEGVELNKRYFVKFSSKDHNNQRVISLEVPEDFPEPPPEGWGKLPGKLFDKLYPEDVERIKKKYKIEVEGYN